MARLDPPAPLRLRGAKWRLREAVQVNRSGWTGRAKVVGLPGAAYWTVEGEAVATLGEASFRQWRGWLMSLRGPLNSFAVRATENQQTTATGAYHKPGGPFTAGTSLPLTALPASTTVLRTGDMMTVTLPSGHRRLVSLTADLVSDSGGNATAKFAPELGEVPVTGVGVELQWPYALMRMTADPPGWDVDTGQLYGFALSAEEAL